MQLDERAIWEESSQPQVQAAPMERAERWLRLFWWTVFGAAFGCIEAAVVVYLRKLMGMAPGLDYPRILSERGLPFQAVTIREEIQRQGLLTTELTREVATLLLLASAACAAGRSRAEKWGIFGYTFAIWDLSYYVYLALWIGFPRSLLDTDIYFLIPVGRRAGWVLSLS